MPVRKAVIPAAGLGTRFLPASKAIPSSPSPVRFFTELDVATSGPDLRPFIDKRVRLSGDVLGGDSDLGGAAVVLVVKDIARLEPAPTEP